MKVVLHSGGRERTFVVLRRGDTVSVAAVAGDDQAAAAVDFRVVGAARGELVLESGQRRLRLMGGRPPARGSERQLWIGGRTLTYRREGGAPGADAPVGGELTTAIPAVVLEVLVAPGERVVEGQRLLLLESMKMVLPVTASQAGVVNAILCAEGDAVQPGTPLIDFLPDGQPAAD